MENNVCSFCGKNYRDLLDVFIKYSTNISICSACVKLCHSHISDKRVIIESEITPRYIIQSIKEYVIGQDEAIKDVASVLFKHLIFRHAAVYKKNNCMIIGRSGTGKSYIFDVISRIFDIPMIKVNVTGLTASGYHGPDVSSILERLYNKTGGDKEKTQTAIILLDEIDKLCMKNVTTRDIGGASVQEELLPLVMGDTIHIFADGKSRLFGKPVSICTNRILVIAAGAFEHIENIYTRRVRVNDSSLLPSPIETTDIHKSIDMIEESLIEYGMKTELIGRFHSLIVMNDLKKDDYLAILRSPANETVNFYKQIFSSYNIDFTISDEAYEYMAECASKQTTGSRALDAVLNKILNFYVIDIDIYIGGKINIELDDVKQHLATRSYRMPAAYSAA